MSALPDERPARRLVVVAREGELPALARALADRGHRVVLARTGVAALRYLCRRGRARLLVLRRGSGTDGMVEEVEQASAGLGR